MLTIIKKRRLSKAFTLIELLAVIVILAVVSLITVPVVLNIIEKARKGAFEDTAYGVIDAAKLYYADASFGGKSVSEIFTFPVDTKLKLSGKKPKSGTVILDEDGKVSLAISNGTWCAKKGKDEEKVTIVDYSIGGCEIGSTQDPDIPPTAETCFTVNETGETITGYTCTDTDIVIPETINGVEIKKIGFAAFSNKQLTHVTIPNSVTSIGESAFQGNQLTSVTIPSSVTSIGRGAFCINQLQSVIIPNSVTSISSGAFSDNQLQSVIIPDSIISIEPSVFDGNQLTSIEIPNTVTIIQSHAFSYNQLISVTIPDSVTSIGQFAFSNNQLTSVTIPSSVTTIDTTAFYGNVTGMKVTVNKPQDSITGSPWGASSVEWTG